MKTVQPIDRANNPEALTMNRTLEVKFGTSRARDSAGWNMVTLYEDGRKIARCNGGGYDMRGTVLGDWLTYAYADRLRALKPEDMPENFHWQPDFGAFICRAPACFMPRIDAGFSPATLNRPDVIGGGDPSPKCPECGEDMDRDGRAGERIDDGRSLYGLTFHDPNYNPDKAIIGKDCNDRTFHGAEGQTVARAEAAGNSVGLERYQAIYRASSKHATERHIIPILDGGCGMSSMERVAQAIGLTISTRSAGRNRDVITVTDEREQVPAHKILTALEAEPTRATPAA
jgi:hypothetical protein